jgi:hypothetical protein
MLNWLKKNHIIVILSCIVWYCTFLLFYKLWLQSFWIDEWFGTYTAKYMTLNWLYMSKYFLYEWLQVFFLKIWWFTDFRARVPSVIAQIWSILLMYYIPYKLTKNKYVWLISALIFWLLYRELWWWRDARFYALLQLIFLSWIALIIKRDETDKIWYINAFIILTWIWILFHPFLYTLIAIWGFMFLYKYKKTWDFKSLFSKKYLSMRILFIIFLIIWILFGTLWDVSEWAIWQLSWWEKKASLLFYNQYLWEYLWLIYATWLIGFIRFMIKKDFKNIILLFVPFLLFAYVLIFQSYMTHFRYTLLIFPIMIISTMSSMYSIINSIKIDEIKVILGVSILMWIIFTAKFQIIPTWYYYFEFTSPQPDFKSAYAFIPDNQNVISGFPVLCDWYYSDRWTCSHAVRVDLVLDGIPRKLLDTWEKYTWLSYIDDLSQLWSGDYYFVFDNLSTKSFYMNANLYLQINQWKLVYSTGRSHNQIDVMKVAIK